MESVVQNLDVPDLEYIMNANNAAFWDALWRHAPDIKENHFDTKIAWAASDVVGGYATNLVLPLRLEKSDQDEAVSAALERAARYGFPCEWWISPISIDNGLGELLLASGYDAPIDLPAMAVDLSKLNVEPRPDNLEIRHVEDEATLREWVEILLEGWPHFPNWRKLFYDGVSGYGLGRDLDFQPFIGYLDGKPATISSVMYADGLAGIYAIATHQDFRGRGLGAQITLAPLLEAREAGYRVGILQASKMGHPVYKRLGFEDVFQYQLFEQSEPEATV